MIAADPELARGKSPVGGRPGGQRPGKRRQRRPRRSESARFAALRRQHPWFDRLVRTGKRYVDYHGYHYAASITYFSVLSLIPLLMVLVALVGFVLNGQPTLIGEVRHAITQSIPAPLVSATNGLLDNVVNHRVKIGVFALGVGMYSGWNWMNALRDALTAMYQQERPTQRLVPMVVKDLLALAGLAGALVVSFALTATGGALGPFLLRLVGLGDAGWTTVPLLIASIVLAIGANWLVFIWVLARLPREKVSVHIAVRGALAAAIGFEGLKYAGGVYLNLVGRSPIGVAFGWIVGLLVFIYFVARMLMLVTAWTAEAAEMHPTTAAEPSTVDAADTVAADDANPLPRLRTEDAVQPVSQRRMQDRSSSASTGLVT